MTGKLFVISGPSGAGKSSLLKRMLKDREDVVLSVSATTRLPRSEEVEGVDYLFFSDQDFDRMIKNDELLEWASVHGNRYGTLRSTVLEALNLGLNVILEIDTQGAFQVKKNFSDAFMLFVAPPSLDTLRQRLQDRGTENVSQIERRLSIAEAEISKIPAYDYIVINDDFERALKELEKVICNFDIHL